MISEASWRIASEHPAPSRSKTHQERSGAQNKPRDEPCELAVQKLPPGASTLAPSKTSLFNSNGNRRHLRVTSGERRGAGLGVEKSPSRNLASLAARAEGTDGLYYRLRTCGSDLDSSSTRRRGCLHPCTRLALNSSLMRNHGQHEQLY